MHRVDPGHDRPLIDRAINRARVDGLGHHQHPAGDRDAQPLAVHTPTPVVDKLVLQQVITQLPFHQFLTLCRVGAVITAGHTGVSAPGARCHCLELAIAEPLKKRVGPVAFDHAHVFTRQQGVDHDTGGQRKSPLGRLGLAGHKVVWRALLDVHRQSCADACGHPLAFLVILDIRQPDNHGMQQGLATVLANPFAVRDMDHAISRDTLGVEGHAITQAIARVLLEQVIGLDPSPTVTLDALGDTLG